MLVGAKYLASGRRGFHVVMPDDPPELNQYSWKTLKTSGQRIRRGAQNAWQRAKKFGKRMGSGIRRFLGR